MAHVSLGRTLAVEKDRGSESQEKERVGRYEKVGRMRRHGSCGDVHVSRKHGKTYGKRRMP